MLLFEVNITFWSKCYFFKRNITFWGNSYYYFVPSYDDGTTVQRYNYMTVQLLVMLQITFSNLFYILLLQIPVTNYFLRISWHWKTASLEARGLRTRLKKSNLDLQILTSIRKLS